ncbi:putative holin-like toxin [Mesobacillus persicus]
MTVFESLMMAIAFASLVVAILSFNHKGLPSVGCLIPTDG